MKIAFDIMGFDDKPLVAINAAKKFSKQSPENEIILVGTKDAFDSAGDLSKYTNIKTVVSKDFIEVNDGPLAIGRKPESSMVLAFKLVKDGQADAFLSAGSSAAVVTGASLLLKMIHMVKKPSFCPIMANEDSKPVLLLDVGANIDMTPMDLEHNAIIAKVLYKKLFNVENPNINLLNIGVEDSKGRMLEKETFKLLSKNKDLNFKGNLEPRYIFNKDTNIVVTDGWTGNVSLKSIEGTAKMVKWSLTNAYKKGFILRKILYLLSKKLLKDVSNKLDYKKYGGAFVLGVDSIVMKAHGSSNEDAFIVSLGHLVNLKKSNFIEEVSKEFHHA